MRKHQIDTLIKEQIDLTADFRGVSKKQTLSEFLLFGVRQFKNYENFSPQPLVKGRRYEFHISISEAVKDISKIIGKNRKDTERIITVLGMRKFKRLENFLKPYPKIEDMRCSNEHSIKITRREAA